MRIVGDWDSRAVWVDGEPLDPVPSQGVWNHSPDGFNWGYAGSGPAQLALALLLKAGLSPQRAVRLHQEFKFAVIARLPQDSFAIEFDVADWVERNAPDGGSAR
jgi:hypothetical protein